MATRTLLTVGLGSTPYAGFASESSSEPSPASWATIRAAAGDSDSTAIGPDVRLLSGYDPDTYQYLGRGLFSFDMSVFELGYTVTSAYLRLTPQVLTDDVLTNIVWSDAQRGVVLTLLDETAKPESNLTEDDYKAAGDSSTKVSSGVAASAMSINTPFNLSLNSTGIAYLNTVVDKATYPTEALFALRFPGEVDNVDPQKSGVTIAKTLQNNFYDDANPSYEPQLVVTYDSHVKINIGDVWKDVTEIDINIGDAWKGVSSVKLNVGDVWKES